MWVTVAVEGETDVTVVRSVLRAAGHEMGPVHGRSGKGRLTKQLTAYNNAARTAPWLVLRDLDQDAPCAGALVSSLLPEPAPRMLLRVAVRSTEAWLLSDHEAVARFFAVGQSLVPVDPDALADPKQALVGLARRSRSRAVRQDMLPAPGTSGPVGPGYTSRVIEFARIHWRPSVAARRSRSLDRCLAALRRLA